MWNLVIKKQTGTRFIPSHTFAYASNQMSGNVLVVYPPSGQVENYISGGTLTVSNEISIWLKSNPPFLHPYLLHYDTVYLPGVAGPSSPEPLESCCVQEHSSMA